MPTVGSYGEAVSYGRGTPVCTPTEAVSAQALQGYLESKDTHRP